MKNYTVEPWDGTGPIPKPRKIKRPKKRLTSRPPRKNKGASHEEVLDQCIETLEKAGIQYYHVPDTLYRLICGDPTEPLSYVLERGCGPAQARQIKEELACAAKGMLDLVVAVDLGNGLNLALIADIKVGADHLKGNQRRYARGWAVKSIGSAEDFKDSIALLSSCAASVSKKIN